MFRRTTSEQVVQQQWGKDLIASWNTHGWWDMPLRVGGKIARLIGAAASEVVVADSTSINIFKAAAAAVRMRPGRNVILTGRHTTTLAMQKT